MDLSALGQAVCITGLVQCADASSPESVVQEFDVRNWEEPPGCARWGQSATDSQTASIHLLSWDRVGRLSRLRSDDPRQSTHRIGANSRHAIPCSPTACRPSAAFVQLSGLHAATVSAGSEPVLPLG